MIAVSNLLKLFLDNFKACRISTSNLKLVLTIKNTPFKALKKQEQELYTFEIDIIQLEQSESCIIILTRR